MRVLTPSSDEASGDAEGEQGENEGQSEASESQVSDGDDLKDDSADFDGQTWTPDAVDVREDRVIAFGTVPSDEVVYHYKIKAVNAGTFTTPPAYVESMYDRAIKARGVAGTITVR